MNLNNIPFGTTDWQNIPKTEHTGDTGVAYWRTQHFDNIRVRMVEYSAGYLANHWCKKGHILLCLSGEMLTELDDGRIFTLKAGMSYQVADNAEAHRSSTVTGAVLFIVD
ncbi:MAG: DHCW motif cupin fold protein [Formosimonas sp.]|jgi:quercetin dioxygenase-like cupin family protein